LVANRNGVEIKFVTTKHSSGKRQDTKTQKPTQCQIHRLMLVPEMAANVPRNSIVEPRQRGRQIIA
jgi:hypothetical protein